MATNFDVPLVSVPPPRGRPAEIPIAANDNSPELAARLAILVRRVKVYGEAGLPFTLRTADEIALYTDLTVRAVFNMAATSRMPFHYEGAKLCLRVDAYERLVAMQQWCRMNGVEFDKHAREWGFPKPDELAPPLPPRVRQTKKS